MASNFNELAIIPHTHVFLAAKVSGTYANKRLQKCIDEGIVKRPCRTVTGRTLLTPPDAQSYYEALISVR